MGVAVRNQNYNSRFQDVGGTLALAATDGDATLVTNPNAAYSIFVQKIRVHIFTSAAQSATFEDTATTARVIAAIVASPGTGYQEWDFGPQGIQLTEGKNFVLNVSAAGLGMNIEWEAYMRPTAASRTAANL